VSWLIIAILVVSGIVAFYFALLAVCSLLLTAVAAREVYDHALDRKADIGEDMFTFPLTPPVSVLLPAYNESAAIVESVASLLGLRYPEFEVIVINDGSKDDTLQQVVEAYGLEPLDRDPPNTLETQPIRGIYQSRAYPELIVIDKENGGKADSLNAGINASRYPLVCGIDADSILEPDALLRAVEPFVLRPELVIATGGIVRIANGSTFARGTLVEAGLPKRFIPGFQVVEYMRGFLVGRCSWSRLNALLIVSGAFGLFRKDVVVETGGYAHTIGEDAELVVRMQRHMIEQERPYRVEFVPDAVCWTEAPESLRVLRRQRTRWQRGLYDTLSRHRTMLFNPRYGTLGTMALPYFFLFELLGPAMEGLAVVLTLAMWAGGLLNTGLAPFMLSIMVGLGLVLSISSLVLEELVFHRYPRWKHILTIAWWSIAETVGYRQINSWWRITGLWEAMRKKQGWGAMTRTGAAAGQRQDFGGGRYWSLRAEIGERLGPSSPVAAPPSPAAPVSPAAAPVDAATAPADRVPVGTAA
jgi:cellulose synthase/poly-beta-1,6-N-acetylglucosamine synthase-like glycosyltransferase